MGLTLEEVAMKIGTTKQTIQRYETGEISNIPSDKIEKLAMVYNTTPIKIMGWEIEKEETNHVKEETNYITDERKNLINQISRLSDKDFQYIAELVARLSK
jgi:transcriptional regulator with XRE-family HTH domain